MYNCFLSMWKEGYIMQISPKMKNAIEWGYCIIIAVVLALLVRYFVGTPTIVKQPSMYDTLVEGQRLILSRWTRTVNGEYERGDIVTFEAPTVASVSPFDVDMENPVAIYEYSPKNVFTKFTYYVLEINKVSYIKRVIGVAGDHVKVEDGIVYLKHKGETEFTKLDEPYLRNGVVTEGKTFKDVVVPEGYVFVMGDNRAHSTDSREFGCIPIEKVESKVWIRFWPLTKFGGVK